MKRANGDINMGETTATETKPIQFLAMTLVLQFSLLFVTFFNIPVARQIIGFLYLTFIPGFVTLKLLKLNKLGIIEKILFSVGLSIALLMLIGLAINGIGPLIGIQQPLQFTPLILVISGFVLLGAVVHYLRSTENLHSNSINTKTLLKSLLLTIPTILSVIGAFWANITGNNSILLLMILVVAIVFAASVLSERLLPSKYHAIIIFSIGLALLFHSSLISNYILSYGSDATHEYAIFTNTQNAAYWNPTNPYFGSLVYGRFHSMLSITILPTFYSYILNLDSTLLFQVMYPLIFAFVPLCLYQLWQKQIGKKYAFIAAFLFMTQQTFYTEMVGLNRQIVAELFFALLLLVILDKTMKPLGKTVLFTIFSFGLVTSHYGLSEIFLFFTFATFAYPYLTKQTNSKISKFSIVIFPVIMFLWYVYMSGSAVFTSILDFGNYVLAQFGDFLNPAARGQTVLRGLGLESAPTVWNALSRGFAYATQFLIVIGFIGLIAKKVKSNFDKDHLTFTFIAMALLGALIIVPGLANTLNMTRFYHILLFFLAPLCVLGAVFLVNLFSKRKELLVSILLIVVLVPYFLFQTNFVYEVTGSDSWSVPLSKYRMEPSQLYGQFGYIDAYSAYGAQWLSKNINFWNLLLYSDSSSRYNVLTLSGIAYRVPIVEVTNITTIHAGDIIYLSTLNTQEKIIYSFRGSWNFTELSFNIDDLSKVYTNGQSEIYKNVS